MREILPIPYNGYTLRFGSGTVGVAIMADDVGPCGIVMVPNAGAGEIGAPVPGWGEDGMQPHHDGGVMLLFERRDSIDVVIEMLQEVRDKFLPPIYNPFTGEPA